MKSVLRWVWRHWSDIARAIGDFQSRLLLTLFYFTVLAPFGVGARVGVDPLRLRRRAGGSAWVARGSRADGDATRQF